MREIKFRAWDKSEGRNGKQQMFAVEALLFKDGAVRSAREKGGLLIPADELILMEWTGLKDKSGKEIYEDDIVRDGLSGRTGIVKFNHGMFVITYKEISNWKAVSRGGSANVEVLGNIYEHPHLLNHES